MRGTMGKKRLIDISKVNPERLMTIGDVSEPYEYDISRLYVEEMAKVFNPSAVAEELKKEADKARYLSEAGRSVFAGFEALEKKYRDRTAEVMDEVAKRTGIYFPHVFQRYIEIFYIGTMPRNKYEIRVSTIKELKMLVHACTFKETLNAAGIDGGICKEFCMSAIDAVRNKLSLNVRIEIKGEPSTPSCELQFINPIELP